MWLESDRQRALVVAGVALLLLLSFFSPDVAVPSVGHTSDPEREPDEVKIVDVHDNSSAKLWPYTSREREYDTLTLPINVVVEGNATRVWYLMMMDTDARWNASNGEWTGIGAEDESAAENGTHFQWGLARGSTRYTYIYVPNETRRMTYVAARGTPAGWTDATFQLHDGAYFGKRFHARIYAAGTGRHSWTAIQAHQEHWDWYRLRHTVGSLASAQKHIEEEFRGEYSTASVTRQWYANGGIIDSDGWVTVIQLRDRGPFGPPLAVVTLLIGFVGRDRSARERIRRALERAKPDPGDVNRGLLFLAPIAITMGVRAGSIAVERAFPHLSPKLVAAGFYPTLVVGLPVFAFVLARGLPASESFTVALIGLGVAQLAEYAYLGVSVLPIGVIVHRTVLITAFGFVAAGGSRSVDGTAWNDALAIGLAGWLLALVWPLVGVL